MLYSHTTAPPQSISDTTHFNPDKHQSLQHGHPTSHLLNIPSESLTAITSFLNPPALQALAAVCRSLREHVADDNTWRRAFVSQYLAIAPETELHNHKNTLMLRSSERSWRDEFITRYSLRRRWQRSRNATITHQPIPSSISLLHLLRPQTPAGTAPPSLLTGSLKYGILARSLPLSGKVLPGYIDASATRTAGWGIGNPNVEFTPNISACAVFSSGGTARVAWGFRTGEVAVVIATRVMDPGRRMGGEFLRCAVGEGHVGAVVDVVWSEGGSVVASAGMDGKVKVWEGKSVRCLWTSELKGQNLFIPDPCVKLAVSVDNMGSAVVAGVMKSGEIHIWNGVIELEHSTVLKETVVPCPIDNRAQNEECEVMALHVDPTNPNTILVAYYGHPFFYRVCVVENSEVQVTAFGDVSFGPISCIFPCFAPTVADEEAQGSSFIIVGDHLGCVSIYVWSSSSPSPVAPIRKFEAHEDGSSVTSIAWNPTILVTGSSRGTTNAFDALTFEHLRSFNSPLPRRHAFVPNPNNPNFAVVNGNGDDGRAREGVTQILLGPDKEFLCVAVGDRVMAWQVGVVPKTGKMGVRGRHTGGSLRVKKRAGAKWLQQVELNQTISESQEALELESQSVKKVYGREREQRAGLESLGLSEVEAVEYVLMLSRDEAIASSQQHQIEEGVFEGDFDDIPSLNAGSSSSSLPSWMNQPHALSKSSSSSSLSSSSRSGVTITPSGRPIPRVQPSPSSSNQKIRVSPPFREAMEAGLGGASSNSSKDKEDPVHFPPIPTPISASPSSSSITGSPKSVRSSSASAWSTPLSLSLSGSPAAATSMRGGGLSGVAASLSAAAKANEEEYMDDDLRFALELSLAEAKSRGNT